MRSDSKIYDSFLRLQVELSFTTEETILRKSNWEKAVNILDYGCGNAYFSYMLSQRYPDKKFHCYDRNKEILKYADITNNMIVEYGEYPHIKVDCKYDFIILRHLTSYLTDRASFFTWLKSIMSENASILLIDAYDDNMIIEPYMPHFMKGINDFYDKIKNDGGCRNVFDLVEKELFHHGFNKRENIQVIVNSNTPCYKEKLFVYMNLAAEIDNGLPLSENIREELMNWVTGKNSYVQYGLFASIYELNE